MNRIDEFALAVAGGVLVGTIGTLALFYPPGAGMVLIGAVVAWRLWARMNESVLV